MFWDFANYLVAQVLPKNITSHLKKKFFADVKHYMWEDLNLFLVYADQIICRCVSHKEGWEIIRQCDSGHTGGIIVQIKPR